MDRLVNTEKMMIAKNEIENVISNLGKTLSIDDFEMLFVLESVCNTVRHKCLTRQAYQKVSNRKESDNGNTNEKGQ